MSEPKFHLFSAGPTPVAPFSHAVEVDDHVVVGAGGADLRPAVPVEVGDRGRSALVAAAVDGREHHLLQELAGMFPDEDLTPTHADHLAFGVVIEGMDVVESIIEGDVIKSVTVEKLENGTSKFDEFTS